MKNKTRCSWLQFLSGIFSLRFSITFIGLMLGPLTVQATTFNWNCNSGNWANTTCWNPNGTPTNGDSVYVPTISGADTSLTIDSTTGTAISSFLYLGTTSGTTVTLHQTASTMAASWEFVGYSGNAAYTQSSGTNSVNYLVLGNSSGSNGTYTLSNTSSLSANVGGEYIGWAGTGTFNQSGGTNTLTGNLFLGFASSGSGTYNLNAGSMTTNFNEYIGYNGTGIFT